jgi:glycosyltransferase involved in cell wall biosynthesis
LAEEFRRKGHHVDVIVLNGARGRAYQIDQAMVWNHSSVSKALPNLIRHLWGNPYDVVFSSARNLNYYLCILRKCGLIKRLLIRDNSVVSEWVKFMSPMSRRFIKAFSYTYRWADGIVCQSIDMLNDVRKLIKGTPESLFLIHNPANPSMIVHEGVRVNSRLVTVGRLSSEKGYERLIRALSKVQGAWEWHIYGLGPLESTLRSIVQSSGLENQVHFMGSTKDMMGVFREANAFLCGSYVEGFPNSVLESILCGVPVIAFESFGGTWEIIRHGENGYLAKTEDEFANYVQSAMTRDWPRAEMALEASERFNYNKIMTEYEAAFHHVLHA